MAPPANNDTCVEGFAESAPDCIVLGNRQTGEIVELDRAGEALFGHSQEDLRSMDVFDLHAGDERERYERLFETQTEQ